MTKSRYFVPFLIAFLLVVVYGNTLTLKYALDDRLVIFENNYTLSGFDGVKDIFSHDSFSGYFLDDDNLVAGGRYRPLSQFTFVLEFELFGGDLKDQVGFNNDPRNEQLFSDSILPFISHLTNLFLFFALCLLIYYSLKLLFEKYDSKKWYLSLPLIATLLFALHPIHTEAVANIKGRDEILSMIGAVATFYCSLKYVKSHNIYHLILSFLFFTFAIFSKENAVTFLAVVPLGIFFLDEKKEVKDYFFTLIPLLISTIFFLLMRYMALGAFMAEDTTKNILNDPFVYSTFGEKIATVILTWGIYLKLLIFPHPLTHDYYPKQIAITDFSNPVVWLLIIVIIFILFFAIYRLKRKSVFSFAVLFFVITFSITSNLVFTVGTLMNERFVFVSSLGFTILLTYFFQKVLFKEKLIKILPIVLGVFFLGYSVKTFSRNYVWKDDITLFTTDVKNSSNSIKCNISAGGSYLRLYKRDNKEKNIVLAQKYLEKALQLDPTAANALLLMGELYFYKEDYDKSLYYYSTLLKLNPHHSLAADNVNLVLQQKNNMFVKRINKMLEENKVEDAWKEVNRIIGEQPDNADALNIKGKMFGQILHRMDSAQFYLQKALQIDPNHASALENLGISYAVEKKYEKALYYLLLALEHNPENTSLMYNISLVYTSLGNLEKAEEFRKKMEVEK